MRHPSSCPSLSAPSRRLVTHASYIDEVWHLYDSHSDFKCLGSDLDLRLYGLHTLPTFRPPQAQGPARRVLGTTVTKRIARRTGTKLQAERPPKSDAKPSTPIPPCTLDTGSTPVAKKVWHHSRRSVKRVPTDIPSWHHASTVRSLLFRLLLLCSLGAVACAVLPPLGPALGAHREVAYALRSSTSWSWSGATRSWRSESEFQTRTPGLPAPPLTSVRFALEAVSIGQGLQRFHGTLISVTFFSNRTAFSVPHESYVTPVPSDSQTARLASHSEIPTLCAHPPGTSWRPLLDEIVHGFRPVALPRSPLTASTLPLQADYTIASVRFVIGLSFLSWLFSLLVFGHFLNSFLTCVFLGCDAVFYFLAGGRHRCRYALSGTVFALPDLDDENTYNSPRCSEPSMIVTRHRSRLYRIEVKQLSSIFRLLDLRECFHLASYICTVASTFIGIALAAGTVSTATLALYSNAPPFSPGFSTVQAIQNCRMFVAVGIFHVTRPAKLVKPRKASGSVTLGAMNPYGGEGPGDCMICHSEVRGAEFNWPCGHTSHALCAVNYRSIAERPACPICRVAWTDEAETRLGEVVSVNNLQATVIRSDQTPANPYREGHARVAVYCCRLRGGHRAFPGSVGTAYPAPDELPAEYTSLRPFGSSENGWVCPACENSSDPRKRSQPYILESQILRHVPPSTHPGWTPCTGSPACATVHLQSGHLLFGRPQPEFCLFRQPGSTGDLVPHTAHWFCHVCTRRSFVSPGDSGLPLLLPQPQSDQIALPGARERSPPDVTVRHWNSVHEDRGRPVWFPTPGDLRVGQHGREERHVSYLFSLAATTVLSLGQHQPSHFGFAIDTDSDSWHTFVNAVAERHGEDPIHWDIPGHVDNEWQERAISSFQDRRGLALLAVSQLHETYTGVRNFALEPVTPAAEVPGDRADRAHGDVDRARTAARAESTEIGSHTSARRSPSAGGPCPPPRRPHPYEGTGGPRPAPVNLDCPNPSVGPEVLPRAEGGEASPPAVPGPGSTARSSSPSFGPHPPLRRPPAGPYHGMGAPLPAPVCLNCPNPGAPADAADDAPPSVMSVDAPDRSDPWAPPSIDASPPVYAPFQEEGTAAPSEVGEPLGLSTAAPSEASGSDAASLGGEDPAPAAPASAPELAERVPPGPGGAVVPPPPCVRVSDGVPVPGAAASPDADRRARVNSALRGSAFGIPEVPAVRPNRAPGAAEGEVGEGPPAAPAPARRGGRARGGRRQAGEGVPGGARRPGARGGRAESPLLNEAQADIVGRNLDSAAPENQEEASPAHRNRSQGVGRAAQSTCVD